MMDSLDAQRSRVRMLMTVWYGAGQKAWEYGKAHIQDFSVMRKYEYERTSLLTMMILELRLEIYIVHYFHFSKTPTEDVPERFQWYLTDGASLQETLDGVREKWGQDNDGLRERYTSIEEEIPVMEAMDWTGRKEGKQPWWRPLVKT